MQAVFPDMDRPVGVSVLSRRLATPRGDSLIEAMELVWWLFQDENYPEKMWIELCRLTRCVDIGA